MIAKPDSNYHSSFDAPTSIENDQIVFNVIRQRAVRLVFEPIVSLENGQVVGYNSNAMVILDGLSKNISTWSVSRHLRPLLDFHCVKMAIEKFMLEYQTHENIFLIINVAPRSVLDDDFMSKIAEIRSQMTISSNTFTISLIDPQMVPISHPNLISQLKTCGFRLSVSSLTGLYNPLYLLGILDVHLFTFDKHHLLSSKVWSSNQRQMLLPFLKTFNITSVMNNINTADDLNEAKNQGFTFGSGTYFETN